MNARTYKFKENILKFSDYFHKISTNAFVGTISIFTKDLNKKNPLPIAYLTLPRKLK